MTQIDVTTPQIEMTCQKFMDTAQQQLNSITASITMEMLKNAYKAGYAACKKDMEKPDGKTE